MLAFGVFALMLALYGLVASRAERVGITGPLVFLLAGTLVLVLHWATPVTHNVPTTLLRYAADSALALALFVEASRVGHAGLWRERTLALRLLGPGLLAMIALGTLLARWLLPALDWWECAALAVILTPSDLALTGAALDAPTVPTRIANVLDVESALSDGPVVTALLLCLAGAAVDEQLDPTSFVLRTITERIGLGVVVGAIAGLLFRQLLRRTQASHSSSPTFEGLAFAGVALAVYAFTQKFGGSGLVAAFAAGLSAGVRPLAHAVGSGGTSSKPAAAAGVSPLAFTEAEGVLTAAFVFFALGMVGSDLIKQVDWHELLYAVLSLCAVRPLAVALALIGSGLRAPTVAFIGWFGPRGLASVVLALYVLTSDHSLHAVDTITETALLTVALSVLAHGFSAWPLTRRYAAWAATLPAGTPEHSGEPPAKPRLDTPC